jgi:CubicO group peptidase (beta-lactamase class C family)/D-alanyl-D-alanine dipeptidase
MTRSRRVVSCTALLLFGSAAASAAQDSIAAARPFEPVARMLERFVRHELADKGIPGISIALVNGRDIVWAKGFGLARPAARAPATAETVYRVASISKLFTDLAAMQLVERGVLHLDSPITRYLPDFRPANPSGTPITLRQLMSHRSGLVREPGTGHYFDSSGATLAQTVASLNAVPPVYPPATQVKYSNAGIAVVGRVLEVTQGEPFHSYMDHAVLRPAGVRGGFQKTPAVQEKLAQGEMWTVDGRRFEAPVFDLGMGPAANLYASALDLGRSAAALLNDGGIVRRATLEEMWRPQFEPSVDGEGIGLGFMVSKFEGTRLVGHDGAVYGHAAELALLPDEGLAVAVAASLDGANVVVARIARAALRGMRAVKAQAPVPEPVITAAIPDEWIQRLKGHYALGRRRFELRPRGNNLMFVPGRSQAPFALRRFGDSLLIDDPRDFGRVFVPLPDGRLRFRADTFAKRPPTRPAPVLERWKPLIGEYGWEHSTLYIYESRGVLYAMIEWFFPNALQEISDTVFTFPDVGGLYHGERLTFRRAADGSIREAFAGNVVWPRRTVGPDGGAGTGQLRMTPRRPVGDLLREARRARPPHEPGPFRDPSLVELSSLDHTLRFDIRYATTNNFLGSVFYDAPRALLQRPAAQALVRANARLRAQGYGLLIFDGYRPWYVTKVFWEATPDSLRWLVADPARGSRHNRGAAVDLTLYDLATGAPVEMVGTYDETTARSLPDYPGGTSLQRWHRAVLRDAMEQEGFTVFESEWWHFDFRDWRNYPILNQKIQ